MSPSLTLRLFRRLSTVATSASKPITVSSLKNRLKKTYDPDEALKIYSSFTATNISDENLFSAAARSVQESTVLRLSKSHRLSDVEYFLESQKSHPRITQEPFLSSLIRSYGVVGMFENALHTYQQMTDLGTPRSALSFNALLKACLHSKLFDRVPDYFDEFPAKFGFLPDKFSYGILIKSYCERGSPNMAMSKLNEMEEKGIEIAAATFSPILHVLYNQGRGDEAEKLWNDMSKRGCLPDVGCYNVRLMQIQDGDPDSVKGLIEEMSKIGIKPDTISYNYLITCYMRNGMMDEAKKVYDGLKDKGCSPNMATFRTLIFYLCKHERYVVGYNVFKKSAKAYKIPDFNTLKYLAQGLVKNGHMEEAKDMIQIVNKRYPPNMLKAWGKLTEDLGLVIDDTEKAGIGENTKAVGSDEIEKANN
ncbi:pentatricopeptide repeat-containing protein mitochondrial-like [Dorcoceras hygrometricum]|uniref:Pentatricopeptide repeat-containing protein mitochondrial-like n=1 Tax=Dorcoceras hygrometricum TaxID=472368 RepID=A0A2Z7AKN9_9LAMI|nr:pentatricopeptide repeat-containing protein mitochondrial-like [Dorcoceras hygrometricum]